jgi:hypothetical protein
LAAKDRIGSRQIVLRPGDHLAPQAVQIVRQRRVRDQLLLDRLDLHVQIGIVLQAADELGDELVEAHPQGMLRIVAHLADQPYDAVHHRLGGVAAGDSIEDRQSADTSPRRRQPRRPRP